MLGFLLGTQHVNIHVLGEVHMVHGVERIQKPALIADDRHLHVSALGRRFGDQLSFINHVDFLELILY